MKDVHVLLEDNWSKELLGDSFPKNYFYDYCSGE